jgi:hypothetical protein
MRFFFRKKIISLIICYIIAVTSAGLLDNEIWGKRIKKGGRKNIFKQKFDVRAGEKLLKTSHFFLSTETGAVAGLLFISTEKIAFCSQRSISFNIPNWQHNDTVEQVNILFIIFFMSRLGKVFFNWLYIPINILVLFFWESSVMDMVLQWSLIYFSSEKNWTHFSFWKVELNIDSNGPICITHDNTLHAKLDCQIIDSQVYYLPNWSVENASNLKIQHSGFIVRNCKWCSFQYGYAA